MIFNMLLNKLISLREENDISQNKLGNIIGVNRISISRWENGVEIIPLRKAIKVANVFNTNLDYLFGLSNDKLTHYNVNIDLKLSGNRLSKFRKIYNLTLRKLADDLNTTSSTISSYEMGRTLILSSFAYYIACKYNISIDWLLGYSSHMNISKKTTVVR